MITMNKVNKELKKQLILKDISIDFKKGNVYLLKGHNGSGKTMLLRLICNLISPTSGKVVKSDLSYGVMIENPTFVENETALDNLKFLASIQKKIGTIEIEKYLDIVNLLDQSNVKVRKFSLGMKQRLAFCQAIMENPDVLLLDEPFNALDEENYFNMINYLKEVKKDKIIIVAAHGFNDETKLFDQIITMDSGRIKSITLS